MTTRISTENADAARRQELGAFLRSRRERTSPRDVGLPGSTRRRTPGLRREELAAVAGVSATWYTYLEQGRDIHPSDAVLRAIADALDLDAEGRTHLQVLAEGSSAARFGPRDAADAEAEELSPGLAAMPTLLGAAPAYITGRRADLLAWNEAARELFPGLLSRPDAEQPNLARWMLLDPAAREVLIDWDEVAQSVLARLRASAARHPEDVRMRELVTELRTRSPEAAAWWPRYDIATARSGTKRVRHPARGPLTLRHVALTAADAPDQVLVVYSEV